MKKDDETIKLMADTLRESLTKFVGQTNTEQTAQAMKAQMIQTLNTFGKIADFRTVLPKIEVIINGCEASFVFTDPKTNEVITIAEWLARSHEGFYE